MASRRLVSLVAVAGVLTFAPLTGQPVAYAATDVGNVILYNDTTELCADLPGAGAEPVNTAVWQDSCIFGGGDNQDWGMLDTRVENGYQLFVLVNVKSQLCLDLPGYGDAPSGSPVSIYTCNSDSANDNQEWFTVEVNGMSGEREIVNYKDNLCLDVEGWASQGTDTAIRTPLDVYPCVGNDGPWLGGPYPTYDDHLWDLIPD